MMGGRGVPAVFTYIKGPAHFRGSARVYPLFTGGADFRWRGIYVHASRIKGAVHHSRYLVHHAPMELCTIQDTWCIMHQWSYAPFKIPGAP